MKTFVSTLLVICDDDQFLAHALDAISKQPIDELIVVDTAVVPRAIDRMIAANFEIKYASTPGASYSEALALAAAEANAETKWLWLLHDDSAPLSGALEELLKVGDASPSAAAVGPKQVDFANPRIIRQLGLTLTKRGNLFTRVTGELDQSQHDADSDVLAIGTAGALIRREVFNELAGFDATMPALAADFDFSMRARSAGYRILVAPQARVAHALRSMAGPKSALRKAEIQLQLAYLPLGFALAYWFGLPLTTLVRVIWRLANKRPDRIAGELAAGIWGYFTVIARMRSRQKLSRAVRKSMRALYATKQQVRDDRMRDAEADEIEARVEAHAQLANRDSTEGASTAQILLGQVSRAKSFVASGGLWFAAGLLALSYSYFPQGDAIIGGSALPLAQTFIDLFARAGASWQAIGQGFFAPADPFVWVLSAIGAFTFWSPSLSLAILFFIAKPLAFFAAFKAVSVFTRRAWVRNFTALSYVLFPTFVIAQQELRVASLIALIFIPFVVYTTARVALLGAEISVRTKAQTWTWVALSGLSIAIVTAASPNLIPLFLIALVIVLALRPRRWGYLIWTGLPFAAIFAPYAFYLVVGLGHPLAILADPGLPQATEVGGMLGFVQGSPASALTLGLSLLFGTGTVALALAGLLSRRFGQIAAVLGFGALALALAWLAAQTQFAATGLGPDSAATVNGNPFALLGVWALALVCAAAIWLDGILVKKLARLSAIALVVLAIVPGIYSAAVAINSNAHYSSARVMPALIDAQAKAGSQSAVLVISKIDGGFSGQLVSASGIQLEDLSVAYRFALSGLEKNSAHYASVGTLVAKLISGATPDTSEFTSNRIQYVLVPNASQAADSAVAASLDQVSILQSAGLTEYGKVWRVQVDASKFAAPGSTSNLWSITKLIQLSVLGGYLLLAIPTSGRRKQAAVSEIFIDGNEAGEE
ncbi:MAG: glycosyltransferase family 2 protein [Micrococcales bacterium]